MESMLFSRLCVPTARIQAFAWHAILTLGLVQLRAFPQTVLSDILRKKPTAFFRTSSSGGGGGPASSC